MADHALCLPAHDDALDRGERLRDRVDALLQRGAARELADEDADEVGLAAPRAEHDRRHLAELLARRRVRELHLVDRGEELAPGLAEDGLEQLVLGREVVVQEPVGDSGLLGDVPDPARVEALAREDAHSGLQNEAPLLLGDD